MSPSVFLLAAFSLCGLLGCSLPLVAQPGAPENAEAPHYDASTLEERVLHEVNRIREEYARQPVRLDSNLATIARAHSLDMRERDFVAHQNPDGAFPGDRALRAGYRFREFGENLFRGRLYDVITRSGGGLEERTFYRWHTPDAMAELVVQMWLESPGHRENMLAGRYDYGGVGIVIGQDHYVFITLNLSAR